MAATTNPRLRGISAAAIDKKPLTTAAVTLATERILGTTMAMSINGMAKSSSQLSGMRVPNHAPSAVERVQIAQRGAALPR